MSKYDARILSAEIYGPHTSGPITGWEWYDKENTEPVFILMLNPRPDAMGDMSGRKKTLIWEEWFAYRGWLRKQPTMWAKHREGVVDSLMVQVELFGLDKPEGKVKGKNGSKEMIPCEQDGKKAKSLRFEQVDCDALENNVNVFEKLLQATATMTADEHCEAFKRLQQTIG